MSHKPLAGNLPVNKELFMYDLAIVAIMKNEGHYVKEWLDYHLLAGVEHFYIYDNESEDNLKEILAPYIELGLVTYTYFPGPSAQLPAYEDALKRFRFFSRYIAFIDGDEFILPQEEGEGRGILAVAEEILRDKPRAGALAINWHWFGSSGEEKADYSRGVLERFLHRADSSDPERGNQRVKDIVNPRRTDYFDCMHKINHYQGYVSVNEEGGVVYTLHNDPITDSKLAINHYSLKSLEEYLNKNKRGDAVYTDPKFKEETFRKDDHNDLYDDRILRYRADRYQKAIGDAKIPGGGVYPSVTSLKNMRRTGCAWEQPF